MRRRDVEGSHRFSREVAEACGIYELGGLLLNSQGEFTAAAEAFELERGEVPKGGSFSGLLRREGYERDILAGCAAARELGIPFYLFAKVRGEPGIHQYEVTAQEGEGEPRLKSVSYRHLGEEEFLQWWREHKQTEQKKTYRRDFQERASDSYFDHLLEGHGLKWGGNIDGLLIPAQGAARVAAVVENRYTNQAPLKWYDPGKHFDHDIFTWRPLILLRKKLNVPLVLTTYSRRPGEERAVGMAQVLNEPEETGALRYRGLPPGRNIVHAPEDVMRWLSTL